MAKIVIIGAGSHTFSRNLITDMVSYPELRDSTITLMDIEPEPLDLIASFGKRLVKQHGFNNKIESTTDRRKALDGADYVICTIQLGGIKQQARDIAAKYGLADGWTGPASGLANGLSQIPVIMDICRDMEELCPDAWLLEYANPLSTICWAINDYTKVKNVGLCHSVPHTAAQLAKYIDKPLEEVSYWVAGINHLAWFLEFKWKGKDAYPLLREKFKDPKVYSVDDAHWAGADIVRAEVLNTFGYFLTEASFINAYYMPYFRKSSRPDIMEKYKLETDDHPERHPKREETLKAMRQKEDKKFRDEIKSDKEFTLNPSREYGAKIIYAMETGIPARVNGNVKNTGLITNLSEGSCVEVPCLIDREGIHPCYVGALPPQLAALNQANICAQEMVVRGIMEKDKNKVFQAGLLDPLTAAILTIDEARQMVDELFAAEKEHLKGWKLK
jgi:alpha-galactosidase